MKEERHGVSITTKTDLRKKVGGTEGLSKQFGMKFSVKKVLGKEVRGSGQSGERICGGDRGM